MSDVAALLRENLNRVREKIAAAARAAGRSPNDVRLVAVTKYVSADVARQLFAAGCHDLGESRPQELWSKAAALADLPIRWHLIGHLQRNKVRRTLPAVTLFHSVDSLHLADEIAAEAERLGRRASVLLEVNISGDATKHGVSPGDLAALVAHATALPSLDVQGLMSMAALDGHAASALADFRRLRALRDVVANASGVPLKELSLGMSGDYEAAIAAGSTLVRIGSALFEGLENARS